MTAIVYRVFTSLLSVFHFLCAHRRPGVRNSADAMSTNTYGTSAWGGSSSKGMAGGRTGTLVLVGISSVSHIIYVSFYF